MPGRRVLMAYGKQSVLEIIMGWFMGCGYQISMATDGRNAWRVFSSQPSLFDLVLMDFELSQVDGEDLATRIKTLRPDLPVVLLTDALSGSSPGNDLPGPHARVINIPISIAGFLKFLEEIEQETLPVETVEVSHG